MGRIFSRPKAAQFHSGLFFIALLALLLQNGTTFLWLLVATGLLTVITMVSVARASVIRYSLLHAGAGIAFLLLALSMCWSVHPNLSFVTFWKLALGIWVLFLFPFCGRQQWRWLSSNIIILTLLGAIWGGIQYLYYSQRIAGPQIDANAFAAILYVGSFLWLSRQWSSAIPWRWQRIIGQFLLLCVMMATFSRGGIATWMLGCAAFCFIGWKLKRALLPIFLYLLIGLCAYLTAKFVLLLVGGDVLTRHFQDISSFNGRTPLWEAAWTLFTQNTWFGTGLGTFSVLYPAIRTEYLTAGNLVHNDYLQLLHEGGIALVLLLVLFLFWHIKCLWQACFCSHKKERFSLRLELACLAVINLLLFTHALINFIFYIEYLNIVAGLIATRMCWLAWRLGYIRMLSSKNFSIVTKAGVIVAAGFLWIKLALMGIPHLLFVEWKEEQTDNILVMPVKVADMLLTIDPLNAVASGVLIQSAYASIPVMNPESRQITLDSAWAQASLLKRRQPAEPKAYYWLGVLKRRAEEYRLQLPEDAQSIARYQQSALIKDPSYFPAHIEIAKVLEKEQSASEALAYLKPHFWKWYRMVNVRDTYQLLGYMIHLAAGIHAPEVDHYRTMRAHLYQWINNPTPFRPRYEGS